VRDEAEPGRRYWLTLETEQRAGDLSGIDAFGGGRT
jgi:hypothetical protein